MARKKIYRAGVIPYLQDGDDILMMFMKPAKKEYGGDSYQIAKGKQEDGEDIKDTALCEAKEELGLFTGNVVKLDNIGEWLGRTTVFIAQIKDKEMFGDPHFETGSVKWLTLEQFMDEGRDLHKPIVKAAYRKIVKILKDDFIPLGYPIFEIFDSIKVEDIRREQKGDILSGYYSVEGVPYVVDVEFGHIPELKLSFANVAFGKVLEDGTRDYQLQNWAVSPFKVGSGVFNFLVSELPNLKVHALIFSAAEKNGDVEERMAAYNAIARRISKTANFGMYLENLKTNTGLASISLSGNLTEEQRNSIKEYVKKHAK